MIIFIVRFVLLTKILNIKLFEQIFFWKQNCSYKGNKHTYRQKQLLVMFESKNNNKSELNIILLMNCFLFYIKIGRLFKKIIKKYWIWNLLFQSKLIFLNIFYVLSFIVLYFFSQLIGLFYNKSVQWIHIYRDPA